jgi:hypothetical protein
MRTFKYFEASLHLEMKQRLSGPESAQDPQNPLLKGISRVKTRINEFKGKAKRFYFRVLLTQCECPKCNGELTMTAQSQCACSCGHTFDPTLVFQRSNCCDAKLIRKTFHYACSKCGRTVHSRFLFDERIFDRTYFKEMMRESRARANRKREEIKRLLAESKSGTLSLTEAPNLEAIPGLIHDLNDFVGPGSAQMLGGAFDTNGGFRMEDYRKHILSILNSGEICFSDITPLTDDNRLDRVWRFVTLIFMQNDNEVRLGQYGRDLLIEKIDHETDG